MTSRSTSETDVTTSSGSVSSDQSAASPSPYHRSSVFFTAGGPPLLLLLLAVGAEALGVKAGGGLDTVDEAGQADHDVRHQGVILRLGVVEGVEGVGLVGGAHGVTVRLDVRLGAGCGCQRRR